MTLLHNRWQLVGAAMSELAGVGAVALLFYYLSIADIVGMPDAWAIDRVVAYLLMFVGPLLIFLPVSMTLRLGPLPLLGAASWALFGYILIFVRAPLRGEANFLHYALFLSALFFALGT